MTKTKGKTVNKKSKRKRKSSRVGKSDIQSNLQIQQACKQAEDLISSGNPQAAVEMLELMLSQYPRDPDLQYYLGYAHVKMGNLWQGAYYYQKVQAIQNDPSYWIPLSALYADLELRALSLHAFRESIKYNPNHPYGKAARAQIALLEKDLRATAEFFNIPLNTLEKGLRLMEEAQIELNEGNYSRCITLNRTAIKNLGDFPPPHNNLSLAQFFHGQPEQAIQTAKGVVENYPDNIQALSNLVRYLAWTGHADEASTYWERLKQIEPPDDDLRHKMLEAATIMAADQEVYRLVNDLESSDYRGGVFTQRTELDLAIAEANLGMKSAQRRLRKLAAHIPWAGHILESLKEGKSGLGWSGRYPYYPANKLLPRREFEAFVNLITREEEIPPRKFRREVDRFVSRFPQIVLVAKKFIYEDQQVEAGAGMLSIIGTPEAYAVLREFALSQVGSDDARMRALQELSEAGQIDPEEVFRFWQNGEWHEIQFRSYELTDQPDTEYSDQVEDLLDRGTRALFDEKYEQAKKHLLRAIELEPRAKEAYNNLGMLYSRTGDDQRAQEMLEKAIEIDPFYVMAICNLALFRLAEDKIEEVEQMLDPLMDLKHFSPTGMAMLAYIRARIAVKREDFETARDQLEMALEIVPDHEPALELFERLDFIETMHSNWSGWQEEQRKRDLAKRAKQREQITTSDPTLMEAIGVFTKEVMVGMGRVIIPEGGWSAMRKAELHAHIVETLQNDYALKRLVTQLTEEEKAALQTVLAHSGSLPWDEFDSAFDNDLDESRYWQWHDPETIMGRLRLRGLLTETTVDDQLLVAIPVELRERLPTLLET